MILPLVETGHGENSWTRFPVLLLAIVKFCRWFILCSTFIFALSLTRSLPRLSIIQKQIFRHWLRFKGKMTQSFGFMSYTFFIATDSLSYRCTLPVSMPTLTRNASKAKWMFNFIFQRDSKLFTIMSCMWPCYFLLWQLFIVTWPKSFNPCSNTKNASNNIHTLPENAST